jgi:serine/threonine-protein phosphatase PP1 catalytic subunit
MEVLKEPAAANGFHSPANQNGAK